MEETTTPSIVTKPTIQFADYEKLDIRLGLIMTCEKIEGTDKLYKMEVQFGSDENSKRTIVSGIADQISEDELIGENYLFILNLPPRKVRGVESEGMILLAEREDGSFVKIHTSNGSDKGAKV